MLFLDTRRYVSVRVDGFSLPMARLLAAREEEWRTKAFGPVTARPIVYSRFAQNFPMVLENLRSHCFQAIRNW